MKKRMVSVLMIGLCMLSLTGCSNKNQVQKTDTKETKQVTTEVADKTETEKDDMSEVTFDYTVLDDGTLSIWSYNAENVPEVFEIPEQIDGQTVTEIRGSLFTSEDQIKEVIIPETVTSIGKDTFCLSTSIEKIQVNGNVEELAKNAFFGCESLKTLSFKDGLKVIGEGAIAGCDHLTDIYLPASVEDVSGTTNFGACADTLRIHVPAGSVAENVVTEAVSEAESNIEVIAE